jgi:hypothetical protein
VARTEPLDRAGVGPVDPSTAMAEPPASRPLALRQHISNLRTVLGYN